MTTARQLFKSACDEAAPPHLKTKKSARNSSPN